MRVWVKDRPSINFESGAAVTIGNFDGVHLGHKQILEQLRQEATRKALPTVLITFEPSPSEFFAKIDRREKQPKRITALSDKLALLQQTHCLDYVWVLPFDQNFAAQSAQSFINDVLINTLNTQFLLIGDDFCFGSDRLGNITLLQEQTGFETQAMSSILIQNKRASSSEVRKTLASGDFEKAKVILGHDFFISGIVVEGKKLARQLGYPTANLKIEQIYYPLNGVFVVEVEGKFGKRGGVANLGLNPTVSNTKEQKLEIHLFDFDENLYGEVITIYFLKKIRDELKFPNIESLKSQIYQDGQEAQTYLLSLGRKND